MAAMETPKEFAKRSGVSEKLIRAYVKQGKLPHILTGKSHALIHIDAALESLRLMAEETAADKAAIQPVFFRVTSPRKRKSEQSDRKYKGRPPDSVRLASRDALISELKTKTGR